MIQVKVYPFILMGFKAGIAVEGTFFGFPKVEGGVFFGILPDAKKNLRFYWVSFWWGKVTQDLETSLDAR